MRESWESRVVNALIAMKRAGVNYDTAEASVLRRFPPRGRDDYTATLFDADNGEDRPLTHVAFFLRACRRAWHDEQPALKYFSLHGLLPDTDESMSRSRAA